MKGQGRMPQVTTQGLDHALPPGRTAASNQTAQKADQVPAWYVAFVHPGTWRPYRRCWRIQRSWTSGAPFLIKPLTAVAGAVFYLLCAAVITALLWFVWVSRIRQFLFFGRRYLNFSHLSSATHQYCPTCHPRR
jgi:hypothetical protein